VNATLTVTLPTANVERIGISTLAGQDAITVEALDTVDAFFTVDAGDPTATNKNADSLDAVGGSPKAFVQNSPGGSTAGAGSVFISYPKTTNHVTRIDYANVEKLTKSK
jgi:hypothetical protein